ncbi:carboxylesterase/lipase family protein [Kribbella italica]|uniref:Carboxylic ester hydrolase n=1 Tax=Kribbella italica TaxID=1540520 RepID=A0A7W9MRM7_9ACTN|nr:carboxylesterase family protein [Kribbella italica]MBB5833684.1 para-nitrobenzyl esterase [Kribbella italica]
MASTDLVVTTPAGPIRGDATEYGAVFRAVPYAAPPVGEHRFRPPAPVSPWTEIRDTRSTGPTAPQAAASGPLADLLPNLVVPGDDYLHANVWTPDPTGSAPVMVFIHGGAFVSGSNALSGYDGTAFARDGVVFVTINYRLGADGFLWFGDGVPNLGLLDQVAALTWVRDTITSFGGDPGNVTVMGESAGAMSIGALLTMPAAEGLFHRAILESGAGHHAISPGAARNVGRRLAKVLGVPATREGVGTASSAALIAAQSQVSAQLPKTPFRRIWGEVATNLMPFEPVVDGEVLPQLPIKAIEAGAGAGVDVLVGYNTQEARLFFLTVPDRGVVPRLMTAVMGRLFGLRRKDLAAYRGWADGPARDHDAMIAMLTDAIYRIPALRLAEAHGRAHVYRFAWQSPARDGRLGASHGLELPYVFDNLDNADWRGMLVGQGASDVATRMHNSWVAFAKTGDPGWPTYSPQRRVEQEFGGADQLVTDHHPASRELWAGRR